MNNQVWATAAAGGPIPEIAYAKRWADGNTRSFGDLIQVSDVVYKKVTDRYTTWLKPKAAAAYYQSGVSTGYGIASPWLNMDYSNIPHYGISFATNLDNTTSIFPNNYKLELHATFYVVAWRTLKDASSNRSRGSSSACVAAFGCYVIVM